MYRTIDAKFWTDKKIRNLSAEGKLFVLYLVTNPHSHLCGLYYLPSVVALHETGLPKRAMDTLWHTLSGAGLAYRDEDNQVVWVVNMLSYQGRGAKNEAAAAKQLQTLSDSPLVAKFVKRYPQFYDRVSMGYPELDEVGTPEQEQEQEREQEQEQDSPPSGVDRVSAFDQFWKVVPNKVAKAAAKKAYDLAARVITNRPIEAGPGADDPHGFLLERMTAFASSPLANSRWCPHPASWLNAGRYDDDERTWQRGDERHDPRGNLTAAQQYLGVSNGN